MRIRLIFFLLLFLSTVTDALAQNHLVTHRFIHQKVSEGYFQQRPSTTIPQDDYCISKAEAMAWLYLDESRLPTDSRMPWWSEIIPATVYTPCIGTNFDVCRVSNPAYNSCGSWIYSTFSTYMTSFTRSRFAATNPLMNASSSDQTTYCAFTPIGSKTSLMGFGAMSAPAGNPGDSTVQQKGMMSPMLLADQGPLNRSGIWGCSAVGTEWLFVNATFACAETKQYLIGVGADNHFRVYIDGSLIVANEITDSENFKLWHVFPVNLTAGLHTIRLEGRDDGTPGAIGCEIYDNNVTGLANAVTYNDLKVLFSTKDVPNGNICIEANTIYVQNTTYNSYIWDVSGLNGWSPAGTIGPGTSDNGTFTSHVGMLTVEVNTSFSEPVDLVLYIDGWEVSRQEVPYGHGYMYIDVTSYVNQDFGLELQIRP
ncbi:PA14 domain-containing protein [Chitinophaga niabensis]|uniref:PA14 domain-containing protein n=1 Tax=Chitinophaga niabensis TaxID=536979 RepID=A0A1N6DF18_9BACT|nr:hypothetical protein [Chitinophaga niabensis]SIN69273.1 hypothetical protein SAMN04488055_0674 [Chitinophaga niabensis]